MKQLVIMIALAGCGSVAHDSACLPGSTNCDGVCVSLMSDVTDCGTCGHACAPGEGCTAGACVPACPTGFEACGADCVDVTSDRDNCGTCGNPCGPAAACVDHACQGQPWEALVSIPGGVPAFDDYLPAGQTTFYNVTGTLTGFTVPDAANPMGTTMTLMSPPVSLTWGNPGRIGTKLYSIRGTSMYVYDIGTNTWTTPIATLTHTSGNNGSTADDNGFVYSTATDLNLIAVKTADNTVAYYPEPAGATSSEARLAWDAKSKRVIIGDYGHAAMFSFDPSDSTFKTLATVPGNTASDAFCGDHKGHIFTASSDCNGVTSLLVYTIATDTWSTMPAPPFAHGCDASCIASDDGYLYFVDGDTSMFARIRL